MRSLILLLFTIAVAQAAIPPDKMEAVRGMLRDHKLAAAESAAKALVAANPTEAAAHALLASVCVAKSDPDAAVTAGEKAVALAPTSSEYQLQLGDTYGFAAQKASMLRKVGWANKCRLAYEKAVELDPKNLNARNSLMGFYQNAPSLMGGGMDKAYEQAAEIRKLDASRGRLAYATLYVAEKKYAEAFIEFEAILKETPDNYPALYQYGRLTAISGERVDLGLEALKKCLTIPSPAGTPGHDAANWRLGNLWEKKGDKDAARAAYEASLKINPDFPQAREALKKLVSP